MVSCSSFSQKREGSCNDDKTISRKKEKVNEADLGRSPSSPVLAMEVLQLERAQRKVRHGTEQEAKLGPDVAPKRRLACMQGDRSHEPGLAHPG